MNESKPWVPSEAAACSPPLTDLSPEDAIRRGRGGDLDEWIEEVNQLRETVKDKNKFIENIIKKAKKDLNDFLEASYMWGIEKDAFKENIFTASRLIRGVLLVVEEIDDGEAFNLRVTAEELSALRSFVNDPVKK